MNIIVDLLGKEGWITIFLTCFWFGLFLLIIVLFTTFHHVDFDKDHHFGHLTQDYHHGDFHSNSELHHDMPHDSIDHELDTHSNLEVLSVRKIENQTNPEIQSRYWLGNLSVFLVIFGQLGWFNIHHFGDTAIALAIIGGASASKIFSWFIANYAKTVIVPIHHISRGDIGKVIYPLDNQQFGLIQVTRKDGIVSPVIAQGAFPYDSFEPGELGYIWSKKDGLYTITKGRGIQSKDKSTVKKINYVEDFEVQQ